LILAGAGAGAGVDADADVDVDIYSDGYFDVAAAAVDDVDGYAEAGTDVDA